jgi:hypothetical protein
VRPSKIVAREERDGRMSLLSAAVSPPLRLSLNE